MQGIRNRRQSGRLSINAAKGRAAITGVLAPPARAGHYAVTYSVTDPAILDPTNSQMQTSYACTSSGASVGVETSGYSASATANSLITANFNWTPDNPSDTSPAPQEAIVAETSTVYASASVSPFSAGGSVDDGLGQHDTPTGPGTTSFQAGPTTLYQYSQSCTGNRSSVHTGSGFQVTCSPSAIANCGDSSAQVSVSYSATATPIMINPVGATQDSSLNWDILVGQNCAPVIQGVPAGLTPTAYVWSVSGETFQEWSPTTPGIPAMPPTPAVPAEPDISYEVDGPGPLSIANPSWYWNDLTSGIPEIITCNVTLTPQSGQGNAVTVSALVNVTVFLPTFTATGFAGNVQVNSGPSANGTSEIWAGPTAGVTALGYPAGMNWNSTVTTPQYPVAFGLGKLEYVQTTTPNYSYTTGTPSGPHHFPVAGNPTTGLDNAYPYAGDIYTESPTMDFFDDDAPGFGLNDSIATANLSGSFKVYLLYMPPGANSMWVPLANLAWSINGSATQPVTGHWADYLITNGTDVAGTVTGGGDFTTDNTFPSWANIITSTPF